MTHDGRASGDAYLRCGAELQSLGETTLRTGGSGGAWKLIFGELAELGGHDEDRVARVPALPAPGAQTSRADLISAPA